jgi:hypothetical protein
VKKDLLMLVGEYNVVPLGVDPAVAPPHIPDYPHVEACEQRMWRFQPTCGIMVTSNDHCLHGWSRTMQPFNRLVEQPLCLARWILAIKNIARHYQHVDFPFSNNSNQLVEYSGLLVLA